MIEMTIRTVDHDLETDLLTGTDSSSQPEIWILPSSERDNEQAKPKRLLDVGETFTVFLSFSTGFASSVLANYIYDRLKGRATSLKIRGKKVTIDIDEIQRILEEDGDEMDTGEEEKQE